MASLTPSKSQSPSSVSQSTALSMVSPVAPRTVRCRVTVLSLAVGASVSERVVGKPISEPQISRLATSTTSTAATPASHGTRA